jgi:hypothetical protein
LKHFSRAPDAPLGLYFLFQGYPGFRHGNISAQSVSRETLSTITGRLPLVSRETVAAGAGGRARWFLRQISLCFSWVARYAVVFKEAS